MSFPSYKPWAQEKWLPGVLNKRQTIELIKSQLLQVKKGFREDQIGYSAFDLRLSDEAFVLPNGTIKPCKEFDRIIGDKYYTVPFTPDTDGIYDLIAGTSYLIKVEEEFNPLAVQSSPIYGQATAKSTIGRLDVIARLIVEGMEEYETLKPSAALTGRMYIEITPISFDVRIKVGKCLSQLRLFNGSFDEAEIQGTFVKEILHGKTDERSLSVDIENDRILPFAAFKAKINLDDKKLNLWEEGTYDPKEYWEDISARTYPNNIKSLEIEPNRFYILRSKERISLPAGAAVYCRAMDETLGELRIHYAGFVHPFFGYDREGNVPGTPLIFEVRGHNVKVNLTDGEKLARLFFYRMSEDANKDDVKNANDDYNTQELKLSKIFMKWETAKT